ncbi:AAA family ATPase [Candidatus Phytoplasma pruni]|uniref:AAA family ATPase n=1 Tax=Candidatus Phytoplasma pruni TaxID=479893 RepID=A0A851HBW8_9MOLU|nr:AAA family ATPase [Candidatus Phytoplasma pruni]NWN45488.1 AAA family ATPase [Candidatus Phytoplasma pruni]
MKSTTKSGFTFTIFAVLLIFIVFFNKEIYAFSKDEYKVVKATENKVEYYPDIIKKLKELKQGTDFILENPQNNKVYYNSKSATNDQVVFDKAIDYNQGEISYNMIPLLIYFEGGTRTNDMADYAQLINSTQDVTKLYLFKGQKGGGDVISLVTPNKPQETQKGGSKPITFDDVAGMDEAKDELKEIAKYFNNKALYEKFNIKVPKGALLYGPPGTGKTILMEALATEAGVPYIIADGPEFVKTYVGDGPELLKNKFKEADEKAKQSGKGCIIFIDEIDTIATKRTNDPQAVGITHNKMVNTLLTLLDGMQSNKDVVVIGATNKDDLLDDALTRAGRLDRKIYVGLPDKATKIRLYNLFLKKYKKDNQLEENIDYERLADKSTDFSGATIKKIVNETAFNSIQNKLKEEVVNFIIDNYQKIDEKKHEELFHGRIDGKTDLTNKEELLNYSTTDLDKVADTMKKILFPNEKDYYVAYILQNQGQIFSQDYKEITKDTTIDKDKLQDKNYLSQRSTPDLEKATQQLKDYLITKNFKLTEKDLVDSIDKHLFGRQVLQRTYSEQEKKIVAANEAGHALIQYLQQPDLFYKNTIDLSNNPVAHNYAEQFGNFKTREQLLEKVNFLLAGRAAEELLIGSVSTKSQKDLEEAKKIIEEMVYNQGIEDNHYVSFNTFPSKDHIFYESCNKLLNEAYNKAKLYIKNNEPLVKEIQTKLLQDNYIDKQGMIELNQKNSLNKSPILNADKNPNYDYLLPIWAWLAIVLGVLSIILWVVVLIIKKRNRKEV